jgi:hypothetical protein
VLANQAEWRHPSGAPKRLLATMSPECLELRQESKSAFALSYPLTRAGDFFVVAAPGHTPNHCAVVLRRAGITFLFTGDAVYNLGQLRRNEVAGSHTSIDLAFATMQAMRVFAQGGQPSSCRLMILIRSGVSRRLRFSGNERCVSVIWLRSRFFGKDRCTRCGALAVA